tara:strand:- start:4071 stop:5924 length:1854 start_codon:yes stop_codon:yes gene_type:complete
MNRGVFSRSMFNRNARNKLYNMGGLASVSKKRNLANPLGPVGPEDYKFLNDMIRSGNVQGLQSILQRNKPGTMGSILPFQMTNVARQAEKKLNPSKTVPEAFQALKSLIFGSSSKDTDQKTIVDDNATEVTASETLNNLTDNNSENKIIGQNLIDKRVAEKDKLNVSKDEEDTLITVDNIETPLLKPNITNEVDTSTTESTNEVDTSEKSNAKIIETFNNSVPIVDSLNESNVPEENNPVEVGENVNTMMMDLLKTTKEGISDKKINEQILELWNKKSPDQTLSKKEAIKANMELYKELLGEDPEDIKSINGFNLAYLGFSIAAGASPNALQNIAEGSKEGVKNMANTQQQRQKREDLIETLAVRDYLDSDAAEKKFQNQWNLTTRGMKFEYLKMDKTNEQANARWIATQVNARDALDKKLANSMSISLNTIKSAEERANASNQTQLLNGMINSLDSASKLAFQTVAGEKGGINNLEQEDWAKVRELSLNYAKELAIAKSVSTDGTRKPQAPTDRLTDILDSMQKQDVKNLEIANPNTGLGAPDGFTPNYNFNPDGSFTVSGMLNIKNRLKQSNQSQLIPKDLFSFNTMPTSEELTQLFGSGVKEIIVAGEKVPIEK